MPETTEDVRPRLTDDPDLALGAAVAALYADPAAWIHRRIDTIVFSGELRTRRHLTVDFTLPRFRTEAGGQSEIGALPIAALSKGLLDFIDARDEDDRVVPLMTQEENSWVAWSVLLAVVEEGGRFRLPDEVRWSLRQLTKQPPHQAIATLVDVYAIMTEKAERRLRDRVPQDWRHDIARLPRVRGTTRQLEVISLAWSRLPPRWKEALLVNDLFHKLVVDFTHHFLLLLAVGPSPIRRRVLKFRFDMPALRSRSRIRFRLEAGPRRLFRSIGWRATPFVIDLPHTGYGASYHFQLEVPPGLEAVRADMRLYHEAGGDPGPAADVRVTSSVVHMHISGAAADSAGRARVTMQAPSTGIVRRAFATSLLIAATLILARWFPESLQRAQVNPDAPTAILLASLSLVSVLVARPGEHRIVASRLFGVRVLVIISGLLAFVAALAVVGSPTEVRHIATVWAWLGYFAGGVAVVLFVTYAASWGRAPTGIQTGPMVGP